MIGDDLGGMAVHLGARVSAMAPSGAVLVSSTVRDLVVGSDLRFSGHGEYELKGVPGRWRIYRLDSADVQRPALGSPKEHMTLGDRMAVRMARRAPGAMRLAGRLAAGSNSLGR